MSRFIFLTASVLSLIAALSSSVRSADDSSFRRQIQTTSFTRGLLILTNAESARSYLGVSTNGDVLVDPDIYPIALTNIAQGGATLFQVLQWDGTNWSPATLGASVVLPSGSLGSILYHDGTNWSVLDHPVYDGRVLATVDGKPAWAELDTQYFTWVTAAPTITNSTSAARTNLSLSVTNTGHTLFDTDLDSLMFWTGSEWIGFPLGVPYALASTETKLAFVAGALRQDSTDRTKWNFITNSTHRPIGFGGDFALASSSGISLQFNRTYSKVVAFGVYPDETFAGSANVSFGANVTTSGATIKAGSFFTGAFSVRYTGAAWSITSVSGSHITPVEGGYTNGVLRITHDYCRGGNVFVAPWSSNGGNWGYIPVIREVGDSFVDIEWIDGATGNVYTSATPSWKMQAVVTKHHEGPIDLDGSNGATSLLGEDTAVSGNIWVWGLFEY